MIKRLHPVIRIRTSGGGVYPADWQGGWMPRLDLIETEKTLIVAVEVSGLRTEDLQISLQTNRLEIKGRKKEAAVPAGTRYFRLEREYGPFRRTLALPRSVVPDRARATLENGVLTIALPKRIETPRRRRLVRIKRNVE
ncbi:MAG: Hsp20/alpha crystallin family protein [Acidobacteriota bacterium]|jgi:HSP20 family protein|nr:Hsp20/alpha crystallin family protein [Acidobacteriota bacterium]OQB58913.1 MAG: Spore protein SP21 [Candidatus Aminicenantes bacterium ADurb.Bin147]HNQ80915.1 Hsp20/alpha crystallin family protein [Candidatus Aminicenantes bacterium]MDD8009969.1 Hsp20/alpha crystallin family protein [Acidobacteriota bacterium]MDD8029180.1 Hsp20/alpha crystallin family protein [Acidobacteriota bacterium]